MTKQIEKTILHTASGEVLVDQEVFQQILDILTRLAKKKQYSVREIQQVLEKLRKT